MKKGDCYEVAAKIVTRFPHNNVTLPPFAFIGTPYLVHAEVTGQGKIKGLRYGHAWVEDDVLVYDFSNGLRFWGLREKYYRMGGVVVTKGKYARYTAQEAIEKMLITGHYGHWELVVKI